MHLPVTAHRKTVELALRTEGGLGRCLRSARSRRRRRRGKTSAEVALCVASLMISHCPRARLSYPQGRMRLSGRCARAGGRCARAGWRACRAAPQASILHRWFRNEAILNHLWRVDLVGGRAGRIVAGRTRLADVGEPRRRRACARKVPPPHPTPPHARPRPKSPARPSPEDPHGRHPARKTRRTEGDAHAQAPDPTRGPGACALRRVWREGLGVDEGLLDHRGEEGKAVDAGAHRDVGVGAEALFDSVLGVRHEANNVAAGVAHTGDVVE